MIGWIVTIIASVIGLCLVGVGILAASAVYAFGPDDETYWV